MYFSLSCSQNVRFFVILHSVLSPSAPRSTLVVCDKLAKWFLTPQKSSDFWGTKKSEKIFLVCSENARPHLRTKVGRVSREHFPTFKDVKIFSPRMCIDFLIKEQVINVKDAIYP